MRKNLIKVNEWGKHLDDAEKKHIEMKSSFSFADACSDE